MSTEVEATCERVSRRLWRLTLVMAIALAFALPGMASQAMAKGGNKDPPENPYDPFQAWSIEDDDWMGLYGVKATLNVVDSTYTTETKSVVCYSVTAIIGGNSWLQMGYLLGWYQQRGPAGNIYWLEATVPTMYREIFDGDTGTHAVIVDRYKTLEIGSQHTFSIYWNWLTGYWEWYLDDDHISSEGWLNEISADSLTIQGECHDSDDLSNGVVKFTDVSYLAYDIIWGRICNPHWNLWELPSDDWGHDAPWSCAVVNYEEFWVWIADNQ